MPMEKEEKKILAAILFYSRSLVQLLLPQHREQNARVNFKTILQAFQSSRLLLKSLLLNIV